ncbi:MAG: hypothetical protein JRI23_18270, partial [Deltaproteobacteria bacterium]|nr:hypothetical protein [Deltaproteobacteria bacterium]MBW2533804.1 hypothetical protein [Deltaproteobacteria bacterium]
MRFVRRHRRGLVAATAAAAALVGTASGSSCFVEGFVLVEAAGGATATGGTSGSGGAVGGAGGGVCSHATWPSPPASADPGTNDVDFVVAARSIDFGEADLSQGATVGYDLDNHCTCQGEGDSCREPEWAVANHCDGPAGRDNAIAELFHDLATFDESFSSVTATERAERGNGTILVRV